jgi:hypothetical protein
VASKLIAIFDAAAATRQTSLAGLLRMRSLQALVLIAIAVCIAAEIVSHNRCDTRLARILVAMKLHSYFSNCKCMKHSLDFSDACNSGYLPLL